MKKTDELEALVPILVDKLGKRSHRIGHSLYMLSEDGWQREDYPETNTLRYENDGWEVEVTYECSGFRGIDEGDRYTPLSVEINRAWGEVTDIAACRYDEVTGETVEYGGGDLKGLWDALDEVLREI